jgi:hypothetical protein
MRYEIDAVNNALVYLQANRIGELNDILCVLDNAPYQVQLCGQKGRQGELIFSPSVTNTVLENDFVSRGWEARVPLFNAGYDTGKDVDFYKNGVVVEVQFAHYGLCLTDISRMERLFTGGLKLQPTSSGSPRPVVAGVEIVVDRQMPTSQSVAHMDLLRIRGAPVAQSLRLLMVGILPPIVGEVVTHNDVVARTRKPTASRPVIWR